MSVSLIFSNLGAKASRVSSPTPIAACVRGLVILSVAAAIGSLAIADETANTLIVATKPIPPLVFRNDAEAPSGYSIDLIEQLAQRLGKKVAYRWCDTVDEQIRLVASHEADIGMAAISITSEREEVVDFSHSFIRSGLRIATKNRSSSDVSVTLKKLASFDLLGLLLLLGFLSFATANLLWGLERRANPNEFPRAYFRGVAEAFWWSVSTLITGGCENKAARTMPGRLVALAWMLGGIALVASFTATLTSRVTTEAISLLITKPEDLSGKKVATVAGTVAEETLIELRAEVISYASPEAAFRAAEVGAAEAVVFDAPVLAYLIKKNTATPLMLVGPLFDYRDYGIVVAEKEGLLEEINRSLLLMIEKGVTRRLHSKWIGGIE